MLQPVAYSPLSPQVEGNEYVAFSPERDAHTAHPLSEGRSQSPPQAPPPPPPRPPKTYQNEAQPSQESTPQQAFSYARSESRHSETSLDQELRQYQQYSEQLNQLPSSSAASIASHEHQQGEYARFGNRAEPHPNQITRARETSYYQTSQQERKPSQSSLSTSGGNHSDPRLSKENSKTTATQPPQVERRPLGFYRPGGVDAMSLAPTAAETNLMVSPKVVEPQDSQEGRLSTQQQSTKEIQVNWDERQSTDSFYRRYAHSHAHDSPADVSNAENQASSAAPKPSDAVIDQRDHKSLLPITDQRHSDPPKSTSLAPQSNIAHYSASALGFGGPSDWEHFGDYDAEEVDDTALYSSSKSRNAETPIVSAAELPVETSPTNEPDLTNQHHSAENNQHRRTPSQQIQILPADATYESVEITKAPEDQNARSSHEHPSSESPPTDLDDPVKVLSIIRVEDSNTVLAQPHPAMAVSHHDEFKVEKNDPNIPSEPFRVIDTNNIISGSSNDPSQNPAHVEPPPTRNGSVKAEAQDPDDTAEDRSRNTKSDEIPATVDGPAQPTVSPASRDSYNERQGAEGKLQTMLNDSAEISKSSSISKDTYHQAEHDEDDLKSREAPAIEDGDISATPTNASKWERAVVAPDVKERRKQFRKNSQQFQDKLKRFQAPSQLQEKPMLARRRSNHPKEMSPQSPEKFEEHEATLEQSVHNQYHREPSQLGSQPIEGRLEDFTQEQQLKKIQQSNQAPLLGQSEHPQEQLGEPIQYSNQLYRPREELTQNKLDQPIHHTPEQPEESRSYAGQPDQLSEEPRPYLNQPDQPDRLSEEPRPYPDQPHQLSEEPKSCSGHPDQLQEEQKSYPSQPHQLSEEPKPYPGQPHQAEQQQQPELNQFFQQSPEKPEEPIPHLSQPHRSYEQSWQPETDLFELNKTAERPEELTLYPNQPPQPLEQLHQHKVQRSGLRQNTEHSEDLELSPTQLVRIHEQPRQTQLDQSRVPNVPRKVDEPENMDPKSPPQEQSRLPMSDQSKILQTPTHAKIEPHEALAQPKLTQPSERLERLQKDAVGQFEGIPPKGYSEKLDQHQEDPERSQGDALEFPQKQPYEHNLEPDKLLEKGENRHEKLAQTQESRLKQSQDSSDKHQGDQGHSWDDMKHPHENTWLDLSGPSDAENGSHVPKPTYDKLLSKATFQTSETLLARSKEDDKSCDTTVDEKHISSPELAPEHSQKSFRLDTSNDEHSNIDEVGKVRQTVDGDLSALSPIIVQDSSQSTIIDKSNGISAKPEGINELYACLDPWGSASLNRYISMLHDEAQATSDKEKLDIFNFFINRESRLRAVLYGAENVPPAIPQAPVKTGPRQPTRTSTNRSEKELPALPASKAPQHPPATIDKPTMLPINQITPNLELKPSSEDFKQAKSSNSTNPPRVDSPIDETQHSPGGRPTTSREYNNDDKPKSSVTKLRLPRDKVNKVLTQFTNYMYPVASPSSQAPILVSSGDTDGPQHPVYKPSKQPERKGESIDYLSKRQSAYRPFAALTMGSLNAGLTTPQDSDVKSNDSIETPTTAIQEKPPQIIQPIEKDESFSHALGIQELNQVDIIPDLRRFVISDFDPLVSVLPSSGAIPHESTELRDMKTAMEAVPDDFSFIHQSVVAWDATAKKDRESHERERHVRQGESERKIDELFNDHEIGYGDISELESEFKRSEAARKADEDRNEYQTFLSSVFDVVWTRLHREIDELTPLYEEYSSIINDALVGKDMFDESTTQFALAPTMSSLLALHQKLEVRYQKAFEAVLERDRRLKKTEVSPWYTMGNVTKVKQLEKQFENAEKNAIVEYCIQRDTRANKLMDVLDKNTLRGVGANQDYMECLMKAVRRVASGRAFESMAPSQSNVGMDEVVKAKSVTTILASSSELIVQTFHVADMLLNAADYEVHVARAKLANSDMATFKRLKEERSKEDQKLMRELEHRLALIRKDSRETHDEIVKLMLFLGIQNGHAETSQPIPGPSGPAHEERIQKALEEAKKRNASNEEKKNTLESVG